MKTEYYVFIQTSKHQPRKVSGPHNTLEAAKLAEQEINGCLVAKPFAYVIPWTDGY